MEERRLRPRVPVDMELELENSQWKKVERARDLSMSGVQVCSDREIPVGTYLSLRLLTDLNAEPIVIRAQVKRCQPQDSGWCVGLAFEPLDSDTSIFLYKLIQYHRD